MDTLFKLTGINGRLISGNEDMKECVERSIDYDEVHKRLEILRDQSYQYIEAALQDERYAIFD